MKVSRTVKEYITKKVCEVYAPRLREVDLDYKVKKAEVEAKIKSATEQFKQNILDIVKDNCEQWNFEPNIKYVEYYGIYVHDQVAEREYHNQKEIIERERDEKIDEIIVTLELGGTKADLENMLANLRI